MYNILRYIRNDRKNSYKSDLRQEEGSAGLEMEPVDQIIIVSDSSLFYLCRPIIEIFQEKSERAKRRTSEKQQNNNQIHWINRRDRFHSNTSIRLIDWSFESIRNEMNWIENDWKEVNWIELNWNEFHWKKLQFERQLNKKFSEEKSFMAVDYERKGGVGLDWLQ